VPEATPINRSDVRILVDYLPPFSESAEDQVRQLLFNSIRGVQLGQRAVSGTWDWEQIDICGLV
jgi:hypothetical protein